MSFDSQVAREPGIGWVSGVGLGASEVRPVFVRTWHQHPVRSTRAVLGTEVTSQLAEFLRRM